MSRVFLPIVAVLICAASYSQDTVNQVDTNGRKQGYWTKYDKEGHLVYEGRFHDDAPCGTFTYYYPNGKIRTISIISQGGKVALTTTRYPNGQLMATGKYVDQQRDSLWQFYSEKEGILVSEEFYMNGKKEGPERIFFPGDGVAEIIPWKEGIREGIWEQFYDDGTLRLQGSYLNDEKEGQLRTFFVDGKLMMAGQYRDGHQDGTWIYYDETGKVTLKEYYEEGIMVKSEEGEK